MAASVRWSMLLVSILIAACIPYAKSFGKALVFDRDHYDLGEVEEGITQTFDLKIRNMSGSSVKIRRVEPSCGCVEVLKVPSVLGRSEEGVIEIRINTAAKIGRIIKTLDIYTDLQEEPLPVTFTANVTHPMGREASSSSVIFQGKCRKCHVGEEIETKKGEILYNAVCFICHKDGASLGQLNRQGLKKVIAEGINRTAMPGFDNSHGGPLTSEQIDSLAEFLKTRAR